MERRASDIADQKQETLALGLHPRSDAIAQNAAVASQTLETTRERSARPESVLDEIQRATRQPLGYVKSDNGIAGNRRGQSPSLFYRRFGYAEIGVRQIRQARQSSDGRSIKSLMLNPCDEMWQHPSLNGWTCRYPAHLLHGLIRHDSK
jgi:hypothetical protein